MKIGFIQKDQVFNIDLAFLNVVVKLLTTTYLKTRWLLLSQIR